jgi:hypothetical protein
LAEPRDIHDFAILRPFARALPSNLPVSRKAAKSAKVAKQRKDDFFVFLRAFVALRELF